MNKYLTSVILYIALTAFAFSSTQASPVNVYTAPVSKIGDPFHGVFIGIGVGGANSDVTFEGFIVDKTIGNSTIYGQLMGLYQRRLANTNLYYGIEAQLNVGDFKTEDTCGRRFVNCVNDAALKAALLGRLGFRFNNFLPYFTAGKLWSSNYSEISMFRFGGSDRKYISATALGGGLQVNLFPKYNTMLDIQALHLNYDDSIKIFGIDVSPQDETLITGRVVFKLN